MTRPGVEVADVVRQYGDAYLARYRQVTSGQQRRALRAIALCRTAALGGHLNQCDHCGHEEQAYNSCRHRSCPKCQGAVQAAWLHAREREVLDTPYVHVIFTLPHDLGPLALQNPRVFYGMLFRTVAQTLQDIARDPTHLGAEIGGFAVLHTWGQQLHHHPHLHCVLPAGGLAPDGSHWVPCRRNFFLPVTVLSRRFRRVFLDALTQVYRRGELTLAGRCQALAEPTPWQRLLATLRAKEWVVYAKKPLRDPQHVLAYLARYTQRGAVANQRLLALADGKVTFRWKDYRRGNHLRTQTLDAIEFLRRLLLHVLPRGFQRIRSYGFLANRFKQHKLARCRTVLQQAVRSLQDVAQVPVTDTDEVARERREPVCPMCPVCHTGTLRVIVTLFAHRAAWDLLRPAPVFDTS